MVATIKGVLLCGGQGSRLQPLTEVVNKHLIRVHDKPMAEYPLLKMIEAGVTEIMIVTGGENFAGVVKYFGSGAKWNIRIVYAIQDKPGGIAEALSLAKGFVGKDYILVCLGDNIWSMNLQSYVQRFQERAWDEAILFSIFSKTPERFGQIKYMNGKIDDIFEKPKFHYSNEIITGIYLFGPYVFDIISQLEPSSRGELEITDVNRKYIRNGSVEIVKMDGWWSDCGMIDTILQTEELLKQ